MELPKTEQELNELIASKVQEREQELTSKHNGEMANMRKKYDSDLQKAKEQANMSAEERAQQLAKEEKEANLKELGELRQYRKSNEIAIRLAKEGLPDFFKNDSRLLNAEEGDYDKVIKTIKKDYEGIQPKGATHSTVVNTNTGGQQTDAKQEAFEKFGEALGQIVNR